MKIIKKNTNTNRDILDPATWTDQDREFIDAVKDLNSEEINLLMTIMELLNDNPARGEVAMNWTGKMKDLPAALARI